MEVKTTLFGNKYVIFEETGDTIVGKIKRVDSGMTENGEALFLTLSTITYGDVTILLSAGLVNLPWLQEIGRTVMIKYERLVKSEKTKHMYNRFNVKLDEAIEVTGEGDESLPFN